MALKYFQKLMKETNWYDKICSYCSHCPGNSQGLGSCEPGTVDEKIYINFWSCDQIHIFLLNHNIAHGK